MHQFAIHKLYEEITIKRGVRQGRILSPSLCNIYQHLYRILDKRSTGGGTGISISMDKLLQTPATPITQSYGQRVSNSFNMIDKRDATCEQYGIEMNAKTIQNKDRCSGESVR